jgi:hypothetical protein
MSGYAVRAGHGVRLQWLRRFVLGVIWSHAVADDTGTTWFLHAVGELSRGSPSPSVVPVRWDEAMAISSHPPLLDVRRLAAKAPT